MTLTLKPAVTVLSAILVMALVSETATQAQTSAPPRRPFDPTGMQRPAGTARNAKDGPPKNAQRGAAIPPRATQPDGTARRTQSDPRTKSLSGPGSREESQQRANERYTALPMVAQPHPKALDPLDPADSRAAVAELAELASFEYYREGDTFSTTNGVGRGAHILPIDDMEQLQRTLRFDRLLSSPDPEFREIVRQARALTEDVNRLNRANHDFGYIPGLEESLMLRGNLWEGMAAISYWSHLEGARDQATSVERLPDGRTVERFDTSRYEELASQPSSLAGAFQLAADKSRAQAANEIEERRLLGRRTDAIRGVLQERMAALWRDKILPRLTQQSGPPVATSPIEIGPPDPDSGPKGAPPRYGSIRFRSRLGRALDHVTLTIQLTDNAGQETQWYLHLPRLEPRKSYQMVYPNGARNVVPGAAEKIDATYTLLSDPGCLFRQPINLASTAPKSPWSPEKREKTSQAIATNRQEDELRRAEERDILQLARRIYPAARNPETTRQRLLVALNQSWRYEAQLAPPANQGLAKLEIEPFTATSAEVKATLKLESDGGAESLALMGRLADESDRGCVLAFVPVEGEPHELKLLREMQDRMMKQGGKYGGAEAAKKLAAPHEARAELRRARFLKGGLPLFTAPGEFRANWQPEALILHQPELQAAISEFAARRKQYEFACDVVYVDEKDRLWLQHMPVAGQ